MAEKIIFLLENPQQRKKIGDAARDHIKANFSWERHINILDKELIQTNI